MDMCFDMVEGASPNNSVTWHAHSSPPRNASSTRMRFSSASAFVILIRFRIRHFYISRLSEIYITSVLVPVNSIGLSPAVNQPDSPQHHQHPAHPFRHAHSFRLLVPIQIP